MIPGMNSRKMQQAMRQMGIQQQEIEGVQRVEILCEDRRIVIEPAEVAAVNMMGQKTFQVTGESREESVETSADISEEDVQTVAEQTGVSEDEAREAIAESDGDLAAAIMRLQS